jgi:UDP-4-amino-4,6-dideoxy-N-acetyl-beta-L-altrosamine transaminase
VIPYGRQDIQERDVQAVLEVLHSDFLTTGPMVPKFEAAVLKACGASYGVAVNSATSALHMACMALGLKAGDWLWTSPVTFVASANCGLYCGAKVDFVDIDPVTLNMSPEALAEKLETAKAAGRLPKVIVPVHLCGLPCDMAEIHALAQRYGVKIIEDASHAIGGRYGAQPVGACEYSDITVFSFHPVKIVTTAEGGMATTNDPALAQKMALFRSHGVTRDPALMQGESDGPWYYQQVDLGYNYRMTDLQAALGVSQMTRLPAYVARRHEIADRYDAALAGLPLTLPTRPAESYSGLHLYVVQLADASRRRAVFEGLRAAGIGVNVHYIPVHLQPYYSKMGFTKGDFPAAEAYYAAAISLPMYPTLTKAEQDKVVAVLTKLLT